MKPIMLLTAVIWSACISLEAAQFDPDQFMRAEISGLSREAILFLVRMNVDIVSVRENTATIYLPAEDVRRLEELGYDVSVSDDLKRGKRTAGYPSFSEISARLNEFEKMYPDICRRVNIGESVQGRELWFMKISDNIDVEEDEPEFKYISTMHGDEPAGMEMCLHLIALLLENYGTDIRLTTIVDEMEIWIMPLMNPDGYENNYRYNAEGKDLNRSFPDRTADPLNTADGRPLETRHLMNWAFSHSSALSANFHTGALVVNYPYDSDPDPSSRYSATPDDRLFREIALSYSTLNPPMYDSRIFQNGVVNGLQWYPVYGGMQDWNYVWMGCMETTIELSDVFQPDYSRIPELWEDNREAMITYMEWALQGVRGIVTDQKTGSPIEAAVKVAGKDFAVYADPDFGDYHRVLLPGGYDLHFSAPGYVSETVSGVTVTGDEAVRIDASLQPVQPGDINEDGVIGIQDSIIALQILTSIDTQTVQPTADINGDGAIGLPEAAYALQSESE